MSDTDKPEQEKDTTPVNSKAAGSKAADSKATDSKLGDSKLGDSKLGDSKKETKSDPKSSAPAEARTKAPGASSKSNVSKSTKQSDSRSQKSWPGLFVLTLVSAVLGAGIATYFTSPAGNTRLTQIETQLAEIDVADQGGDALRGELNALEESLAQIESRVQSLETASPVPNGAAPPGQIDPRIDQLSARLSTVESAIPAGLSARLNTLAPRDEQTALIARIVELEQNNNGDSLRRAGRILALSDLSRAAMGSTPFSIELEAAIATLPDEPILGTLRAHANEGAPTLAQLRVLFPEAVRQALAAERGSEAENIFARLWNGLAGLISIRRIGNVEGNNTGARLARAEAALEIEDLAGAIDEVRAVEGAAAQSISAWLEEANRRLAVENAISGINARIVQTLANQPVAVTTP